MLFMLELFALPGGIDGFEAKLHRAVNEQAFLRYIKRHPGKYIEQQSDMKSFVYGKRPPFGIASKTVGRERINRDGSLRGDGNLCEVIALYNALAAIGYRTELHALIEIFEKNGISLKGCLGTSVYAVKDWLKAKGMNIVFSYNPDITEECGAYIFSALNEKGNIFSGVHTMCITREGAAFVRHNDYAAMKKETSLAAAVTGYNAGRSECLCVIGLGKIEK